jgi:hypothetical protein
MGSGRFPHPAGWDYVVGPFTLTHIINPAMLRIEKTGFIR